MKKSDDSQRKRSKTPVTYADIKATMAQRARDLSQSGRDIGEIPDVFNPERREGCRQNLRLFLETYFPNVFRLKWSADHLTVIGKIEQAIQTGGLFALAMPRGNGKTSICKRAILWAILYGYRKYVVAIGDSQPLARAILETVKAELEYNEELMADFPEASYPVKCLDHINQRCKGQLHHGESTRIEWGSDNIVLPTIPDSVASGAIVEVYGITGGFRGLSHTDAEGHDLRPDFVFLDDPQNDESARSLEQNRSRLETLNGAILGLAGPDKTISGIMACTVIRPGDMADVILDPEQSPDWNGSRFSLMRSLPKDMDLWHEYEELWKQGHRQGVKGELATDFYRQHREAMDEGAEASWPERHERHQLSAIQYAMDKLIRNREAFYAEYQNQPLPEDLGDVENVRPEDVMAKLNNRPRFEVPVFCDRLEVFIDVQQDLLFYTVCAFAPDWTCYLIDYGAYPDQHRQHFTLRDATRSYLDEMPGKGLDAALTNALTNLCASILGKPYRREDGAELLVERCLIDSGWGKSTLCIYNFCRQSDFGAVVMPSKGVGLGPNKKPYNEYRRGQGDSIGDFWMIPNVRRKRTVRVIQYDTNFVKSLWKSRLLTAPGASGEFSIFGKRNEPARHSMLAEQLSAEFSVPTSGQSRRVDMWQCYPGRDNHLLDCVVGCYVAASERGLRIEDLGTGLSIHRQKRRKKAYEIDDRSAYNIAGNAPIEMGPTLEI